MLLRNLVVTCFICMKDTLHLCGISYLLFYSFNAHLGHILTLSSKLTSVFFYSSYWVPNFTYHIFQLYNFVFDFYRFQFCSEIIHLLPPILLNVLIIVNLRACPIIQYQDMSPVGLFVLIVSPLIMFFDKPDNFFIECQIMCIKL